MTGQRPAIPIELHGSNRFDYVISGPAVVLLSWILNLGFLESCSDQSDGAKRRQRSDLAFLKSCGLGIKPLCIPTGPPHALLNAACSLSLETCPAQAYSQTYTPQWMEKVRTESFALTLRQCPLPVADSRSRFAQEPALKNVI